MTKSFHISISISGALAMTPKDFSRSYKHVFFNDDGSEIPVKVLRAELEKELAMGHKIIPSQGCDNFSWETGCLGHEAQS